jgi:hypothetical protein
MSLPPPDQLDAFCQTFVADRLDGAPVAEAEAGDGPVLEGTTTFAALVLALEQDPQVYVAIPGGFKRLTRNDLACLLTRSWLFGVVSALERRMRSDLAAGAAWQHWLSPERIAKARELKAERARRGEAANTVACLQFGDLGQIGVRSNWWQRLFGHGSHRRDRELAKRLEGLRNDLAHGQDVVIRHWDTVVALSAHIQALGGR